jgi:hypothetical protein
MLPNLRLAADDAIAYLPVREFRYYKAAQHYSSRYWSSSLSWVAVYKGLLKLARIALAYFDPLVTGLPRSRSC